MDRIEIKNKIRKILSENFSYYGEDSEEIFFDLDSINYIKYNLLLEKEFNVFLNKKDIKTINDTLNSIERKLNDII